MKMKLVALREAIAGGCQCSKKLLGHCANCNIQFEAAKEYLDLMTPHTPQNATFIPGLCNNQDYEPDTILKLALGILSEVTVVGLNKDGQDFFSTSSTHAAQSSWHLQRGAHRLMGLADKWKK
jgi:hypothetical protein